jgi:hypothetical protein
VPEIAYAPRFWDGSGYSVDGDGALLLGDGTEADIFEGQNFIIHVTAIHGHADLLGTGSIFADADVTSPLPVDGDATLQGSGSLSADANVLIGGQALLTGSATVSATATVSASSTGPRVANTFPGDDPAGVVPGRPLLFGLKSVDGEVQLGTVRVDSALTGYVNEGVLPEDNENLTDKGLEITLETSERRRPITGEVPRTLNGPSIVLTKSDNDLGEVGVYELKAPIEKDASLLVRVRITKKNWTLHNPDWVNQTNMVGIQLGLEHGTYNTSLNVFLRDNAGVGQLVIGGPLAVYASARPGQVIVPFDWTSLALNDTFDIFLYFNTTGKLPPFNPPLTPMAEVWTQVATDDAPVVRFSSTVGSLGQFPDPDTSFFTNNRNAPSDFATLFMGNIGQTGDVVQIDDWEFYTDYRQTVLEGEPLPNAEFLTLPDLPVQYLAAAGKLPHELVPGRWLKFSGGPSLDPVVKFAFNPGRRTIPTFTTLSKATSAGSRMAFQKEEPRLEDRLGGIMIEGFISGSATNRFGSSLAMGFGVEDGIRSFRTYFLNDSTSQTIGIAKADGTLDSLSGYYYPIDGLDPLAIDHSSLKFVRLLVDRFRNKVSLFVEDEDQPVLTQNIADDFPDSLSTRGRVFFGHLETVPTVGDFNVAFLNYLTFYAAWESVDGVKPDHGSIAADVAFVESITGGGDTDIETFDGMDTLVIMKDDYNSLNSKRYYRNELVLSPEGGIQVDFRTKVETYNNMGGQQNAPKTDVGVGVRVFFGTKMLSLGFYDCGIHGKKIAVLPGSGTAEDIFNQTALGRLFSADVDFNEMTSYRLVYRAFDKIEVWANTIRNKPLISIPWRDDVNQFDLPLEAITTPSLAFGHFNQFSSSISKWEYVRWGFSNGYDCAVVQSYPNGFGKHLFGGRALVATEYEDTP